MSRSTGWSGRPRDDSAARGVCNQWARVAADGDAGEREETTGAGSAAPPRRCSRGPRRRARRAAGRNARRGGVGAGRRAVDAPTVVAPLAHGQAWPLPPPIAPRAPPLPPAEPLRGRGPGPPGQRQRASVDNGPRGGLLVRRARRMTVAAAAEEGERLAGGEAEEQCHVDGW